MIPTGRSPIALTAAMLLAASTGQAQSGSAPPESAPSQCVAEPGHPCLIIPGGLRLDTPPEPRTGIGTETLTLSERIALFGRSQSDTGTATSNFGPTWRLKSGVRLDLPGRTQVSAGVIMRRGSSLPLAMVQPMGSDVSLPDGSTISLETWSAPIRLDTEFRVRKMLLSSDSLDLSLVGEAYNLFNVSSEDRASPRAPAASSPTIRCGVLAGF